MISEIVKIPFVKPNQSFSDREKRINTEIQKLMESYSNKGYIVLNHTVLNKTDSNASVKFNLKQMVG